MKKMTSTLIIAIITGLLFSCNGHYRFLIGQPPVPPSMIFPVSPGEGYIWIGGEWYFNGNSYQWRDGYWTRPRDGIRWVPGDWKRSHNEWYYKPGRWRK